MGGEGEDGVEVEAAAGGGEADVGTEALGATEEVMSEVHLGCPPRFSGPYISTFTFSIPPNDNSTVNSIGGTSSSSGMLGFDEDGDLVLTRRRRRKPSWDCKLAIQHRITSSIPSVGLQVWKAAMLLADFVLHMSLTSFGFNDVTALELGAGTGLVGIVLARGAKMVFLTDYDDEVLDNCAANAHLNSSLLKFHENSVHVRKLDWRRSWPPPTEISDFEYQDRSRYSWTSEEIEKVEGAPLLLAADVIYTDELTDSFFNVLESLMTRGCKKVLYMALEKRFNFTLDDLDVVANGYSHFRSFLKVEEGCNSFEGRSPCFVGKQIELTQIPQYIKDYDRGKDLEIWKVTLSAPKH